MKRFITLIATIAITTNVNAENIFKSLWSNIKSRPDLSKNHSNLSRVGDKFFFYKLKSNTEEPIVTAPEVVVLDTEPTQEQVRAINETHPDNQPHVNVIDNIEELDEHSVDAQRVERDVVYGDDSPLRDDAVIAAWDRAEQAKERLEKHRRYMERVRKARVDIEQSKTISIANQTGEGLK